eukprot:scaffold32033_cov45-Isochrysis_galbana.AAC.1
MTLLDRSDRTTRATAQNTTSSRSHAVLQITVLEAGDGWKAEEVCAGGNGGVRREAGEERRRTDGRQR